MRICQQHWDALRKALDDRGIGHLGAQDSRQASAAMSNELEGRGAENDFDPLMTCNYMIWSAGMRAFGLGLMGTKPDGTHYCPVCEALRACPEADWIDGPADAVLDIAIEKGLAKPRQDKKDEKK